MSFPGKDPGQPPSSSRRRASPSQDGKIGQGPAAGHYKGVRMRKWGSWVAEVRIPNSRERIWLGSYDTAEKAARAYDAAVLCLRGPTATFNLPHCLPEDLPPASGGGLTHERIREVAAKHASMPPGETETKGRAEEGVDVSDWGNMLQWPEDPLAGFPSPEWTVPYGEGVGDSSPEDIGGEDYRLWSFG